MTTETLSFKTELKQLLHLIIHSLYSHKDIFLRELISNASDAIDTARFQSLTSADLLEGDPEWKITLIPDEAAGVLTIADNGIGMSRATIVENLGTIARSGTREFLQALKAADAKERPELIGQFGVGFYSAFMVADKVTVRSRMAGPKEDGVEWESDGQGEFKIAPYAKEKRGTDVILHLKQEDRDFLKPWKLRELVKKYSDFVAHPIVMDVETEEDGKKVTKEEQLNAQKALWLKSRSEVQDEEYHEFYKQLTHDFQDPLKTIYYSAEGAIEFKALLFIPAHKPLDLMWSDKHKGLQLYIQRVFILDDPEVLLPRYLRFIRGVVDSPDLPLNVSRELLQQSAPLEKIRSNLVNKILNTLEELKTREHDKYVDFFKDLGVFLKEGAYQDFTNREKIANLLLFQSTKTEPGKFTTLSDYVERMPAEQSDIFFLHGETRELMEQSPLLESFKAKGWEVLLLDDPTDEFVFDNLHEYKGKKLRAVDRGDIEQDQVPEEQKKRFQPLLDFFQREIDEIKEARLTRRLKESPVCLVSEEGAMSPAMERLLARMQRDQAMAPSKRILELNPEHPVVQSLERMLEKNKDDSRLPAYCLLLFDEALIAEGSKVKDPLAFARRVNELLLKDVG
ncbi:MAG: molecular chaperone HtpG [Gemmataceae bacterium]